MHELSVCQGMMRQVQELAHQHHADRVGRIVVRIGPLSGVEPELLRQAFPIASAGTLAEGAELSLEAEPIRVRCLDCEAETEAAANRLLCGHCGSYRTQLISGEELLLASVELSLPETDPPHRTELH